MTVHQASQAAGDRWLKSLLGVLLLAYIAATALGWTRGLDEGLHVEAAGHAVAGENAAADHAALGQPAAAHRPTPFWLVLPFVFLLGAIAVLPLLEPAAHWWESNLHKFYVAANLAALTLLGIAVGHPGGSVARATATLAHTLVVEYVPFIVLLFSLYTISGGIRIAADLPAHPATNAALIATGGLLASFVGTTGAAMLLVRPLVETNRQRRHVAHTIVFFIFIVCNCGGLLTPLGDPPLFLGYLAGVEFWFPLRLWKSWLLINGLLLAVYWAWDRFHAYPREAARDLAADESRVRSLRFAGLWPNGPLLVGIVLSVALLDPGQPVPGTDWHPWFYLREAVQLALVLVSLVAGSHHVRRSNAFDYVAIIEVAVLFIGIFISMQPALEILKQRGGQLALDS
ncbi:MAG TPA: sodium:proton antiporter, partial [Pirellulales bacterium]|nr:sodium:proton antiporter [Pirellulales bacterium]